MKTSKENKRLLCWLISFALVISAFSGMGFVKADAAGRARTGGTSEVTSFTGKLVSSEVTGSNTVTKPATGQSVTVTVRPTTGTAVQTQTLTINADAEFIFNLSPAIPAGLYDITAVWSNHSVEKTVNLSGTTPTDELTFDVAGKEHTSIKQKTDIVGAKVDDTTLVKQFYAPVATIGSHGITHADLTAVSGGTELTLSMQVNDYDPAISSTYKEITVEQRTTLESAVQSDGRSVLDYYSLYLQKQLAGDPEQMLTRSNALITIQIPLKDSSLSWSPSDYVVYRHHEGNVEIVGTTANEQGEYIEVNKVNKMLTLHVKNYCLYVLAAGSGSIWYPTATATAVPTAVPTAAPTADSTKPAEPTKEPDVTAEPTIAPSDEPSVPTAVPTAEPTKTAEPAEPTAAPAKVKVKQLLLEATKIKSTSTKLVWETLPDAEGYDLYQSKCNVGTKTYKVKYTKTFKDGEKHTYLLKGLKKGVWYKNRIYAWKMVDGKKVIIGKSLTVHHYHKKNKDKSKWSNPTGIKLSKTKLTIAKGKTAKITAKALVPSKKNLGKHGKRIRYVLSNTAIASITENGKVKAKKKGKCTIYVVVQSGLKKKVKVTVK